MINILFLSQHDLNQRWDHGTRHRSVAWRCRVHFLIGTYTSIGIGIGAYIHGIGKINIGIGNFVAYILPILIVVSMLQIQEN